MTTDHPSFLELDRLALGVASPEIAAHVRSCPRCSAHVAQVAMLGADAGPSWLDELHRSTARARVRRGRLRAAGLAIALAAGLLAFVAVQQPGRPEVSAKGEPVVVLYLLRDGEVRRLEEGDTLVAGDSLRLGVSAPGFAELTVRDTPEPDGKVLYRGPLADGPEGLLPTSWGVDDQGTAETLFIQLRPVDPRGAPWSVDLTFTKGGK